MILFLKHRHKSQFFIILDSVLHALHQRYSPKQVALINNTVASYHNMTNPPKPLVICGPSGVGKSTIIKRLTDEFPGLFGFSVSHTTRQPRNGECDGVNYYYVTRDNFLLLKEKGGESLLRRQNSLEICMARVKWPFKVFKEKARYVY